MTDTPAVEITEQMIEAITNILWDWDFRNVPVNEVARAALLAAAPMIAERVRAATVEECVKVARSNPRAGSPLCPYAIDKPGDPTWGHTDADICPVCKKPGGDSGAFCTQSVGGRIATAIRALNKEK